MTAFGRPDQRLTSPQRVDHARMTMSAARRHAAMSCLAFTTAVGKVVVKRRPIPFRVLSDGEQ